MRWSPARADTFLIMGVSVGVSLGATCRANIANYAHVGQYRPTSDGTYDKLVGLERSLVGLGYLVVQRFVTKKLLFTLLRVVYHKEEEKSRSRFDLKKLIENNYLLELFYYMTIYGAIGFSAVFTCFFIFDYLGL